MPKKLTRTQVIKQLLQQQETTKPPPGQHYLEETAGYLKCVRCGTNVHKRSNEQTFQTFVQGTCLDQPYQQEHAGHTSHVLWQKGNRVTCTQCGITLHLDGQQGLIHTAAVKKPCKGSGSQSSTPLTEIFRRQVEQASQHEASGSSSAPEPDSPPEQQDAADQVKRPRLGTTTMPQQPANRDPRPTPRRLHFQTALDTHNQASATVTNALAMTPSLQAVTEATTSSRRVPDTGPARRGHHRGEDKPAQVMPLRHDSTQDLGTPATDSDADAAPSDPEGSHAFTVDFF